MIWWLLSHINSSRKSSSTSLSRLCVSRVFEVREFYFRLFNFYKATRSEVWLPFSGAHILSCVLLLTKETRRHRPRTTFDLIRSHNNWESKWEPIRRVFRPQNPSPNGWGVALRTSEYNWIIPDLLNEWMMALQCFFIASGPKYFKFLPDWQSSGTNHFVYSNQSFHLPFTWIEWWVTLQSIPSETHIPTATIYWLSRCQKYQMDFIDSMTCLSEYSQWTGIYGCLLSLRKI